MTAIINFDRDMMWPGNFEPAPLAWSNDTAYNAPGFMRVDGSVYAKTGACQLGRDAVTIAATEAAAIGVAMVAGQENDNTPYRVTAFGHEVAGGPPLLVGCCFANVTGPGNVAMGTEPIYLGQADNFDGCVCVPHYAAQPDWPLVFFLQTASSGTYNGALYVQRLFGNPDTYAISVS